jgi:hypothetical protein
MRPCRERSALRRLASALAIFALASAVGAVSALSAPPSGGSAAPKAPARKADRQHRQKPSHEEAPAGSEGQLGPPAPPDPTTAEQLASSGQVDPLTGLGIRNPVCDDLSQIRDSKTRLSCETSGTPESDYPVTNYGFDLFVSTGVTHPVGDLIWGVVMLLNGIWLGLLFVLKIVLSLLGLAFGLNPFGNGQTMSEITTAVGRLYARITDPWLSTLVVCGGVWFAYKGLVRREMAAGVAGTLLAIAMLVIGIWVVHQPRASVGRLANMSDEVALGVISAPQSGSVSRPTGSYAEAMSKVWSRLVEVPFAGLDFSDVKWALGPPPPEAVEKADEKLCDDVGALALFAILANLGSEDAKEACAQIARRRYGKPKRVIDLYLRSSPDSPAREALWDYFDGDETYKAKVAAQGGDGILPRFSMLALFAIGLLGGILLLAWLSIRLFTQAAIAFVLLLVAPFALFFPMLGDSGRRAFKTWGLTLLGALVAKVIYAAFLSIVLLGITILGHLGNATGFLLSCAFTWSVFLKRAELIGWMSIGDAGEQHAGGFGVGKFAAFSIARRMSESGRGALRGVGSRSAHWFRNRGTDGGEVTRRTARGSLQDSARALADQRYREAQRTVGGVKGKATALAGDGGPVAKAGQALKKAGGELDVASDRPRSGRGAISDSGADGKRRDEGKGRYDEAKGLVARADRNQQRVGDRWSKRDLERFAEEDRALLERSHDPADHAHRAGYDRAQFEKLQGPDRKQAEEKIEKATKRDRQRLDVASDVPGRVRGRGRQGAERMRQGVEGLKGARARHEHLSRLRRDRRVAPSHTRRNLSRGG